MNVNSRVFRSEGGIKELTNLFFPILLMTFTNCLFLIIEKLLLAKLSIKDMEAAVNATYACQLFQFPCVALAMMAQVCVGRWHGANDFKMIGPGIWQFIWFSLLSSFITIPFGLIYGNYYFQGSGVEDIVMPYFYTLLCINFLFPLTTTLSCFFIGQGKTFLVVSGTIVCQLLKLFFSYILIFGVSEWIPSLGLLGGVAGTLIAQGSLVIIFFIVFIGQNSTYQSRKWFFQPRLFWECISPGILRALNRILNVGSWVSIAYLMSTKGGDYLLILSLGGTLMLFLPFIGDAICQAQITVVSYVLGAKTYQCLDRAFRSAGLLALIAISLISIPLVFFPNFTFELLFPTVILDPNSIERLFLGVWITFAFATFSYVPISHVLAFKDTKFSFFMGCFNWVNGFLLMYILIEMVKIEPNLFWLALSLMHGSTTLLYFWRMKWLQSRVMKQSDLLLTNN